MAQPNTVPFSGFLVYMGDSQPNEGFSKFPLAMTTRTWSEDVKTTNITVPDLDNEDELVAEQEVPSTLARSLTGKGTLGTNEYANWRAMLGVENDYRVVLTDVGFWQGPMILTKCALTATRTNVVEVDITLTASDDMPFAKGVPPAVGPIHRALED